MKICQHCHKQFKTYIVLPSGEAKNLGSRKFCLECSPHGNHNTKSIIDESTALNIPIGFKQCNTCKSIKKLSDFHKNKDRIRPSCKACFNGQINKKAQEIKRKAIEYKGGKCNQCSYDKCQSALEFHHLNPSEKDYSISEVLTKAVNFDALKIELDKCMLLCANCHREAHSVV